MPPLLTMVLLFFQVPVVRRSRGSADRGSSATWPGQQAHVQQICGSAAAYVEPPAPNNHSCSKFVAMFLRTFFSIDASINSNKMCVRNIETVEKSCHLYLVFVKCCCRGAPQNTKAIKHPKITVAMCLYFDFELITTAGFPSACSVDSLNGTVINKKTVPFYFFYLSSRDRISQFAHSLQKMNKDCQ